MQLKSLLKVLYFALCCFFAVPVMAQNKTVTGKVTDSKDGSPLAGVSIVASGSPRGTTTDANGNFKLTVPQSVGSLTLTYIGYNRKQVNITGSTLSITLDAANSSLNEVLVVGYGTVRKKDVTGAVQKVSSADFVQGVTTNPLQQIQGKAPGVVITTTNGDPNTAPTVRVRGDVSLTGGNDPLYVIDGVAGADIRSVSPNDIDSYDILKDASAAAIYGSRAAGGVIIVTTKQGKAGKAQVSYNSYGAVENAQHLIKFMNRDQYLSAAAANGITITKGNAAGQDQGANTDWFKEILRTGFTQSHNIAVAGGTESSHYRGSVTYIGQQGIAIGSYRKSINGRFNFDQKALNNKLTITMSLAADRADASWVDSSAFFYAATAPPYLSIYDPSGSGALQIISGTDLSNPVSHIRDITNVGTLRQTVGNLRLDYQVTKDLSVSAYGNGTERYNVTNLYLPTTSVANVVDRSGYTLNSTGLGNLSRGNATEIQATYGFLANYRKVAGQNRFNFLGGYEFNQFTNTGLRFVASDFNGINQPNINIGNANTITTGSAQYSFDNSYKLISWFGRAELNFHDKYYLTGNVRYDFSNKLGLNQQGEVFPSVNAGWTVSNEDFLKGVKWLTTLKLRGGYGVIGNQNAITAYGSQSIYGSTGTPYYDASTGTWRTSNGPLQNANPDLRWEIRSTADVGADFSLFNGRVNGNVDFYSAVTHHLLYTYTVPTGGQFIYGTILANVGQMNNKGFEFALDGAIFKEKDFGWRLGVNASFNRNKIVNLSGSFAGTSLHTDSVVVGTTSGTGISGAASQIGYLRVGYPIGTLLLAQYAGIDASGQQMYYHYAADGTRSVVYQAGVVQTDKRFYSTQPKFTYGITNNFNYKAFDLSIFMRGSYGGKGFNETYMDYTSLAKVGTYNVIADAAKLGIHSSSFPSTYWLQSTSYLKLQNATLGYNVNIRENNYISRLHLYVAGNNIYTFTSYKGVDPELTASGGQTGIDTRSLYPRSRQISFGVNVTLK